MRFKYWYRKLTRRAGEERGMTILELLVAMSISAILITLGFQFLRNSGESFVQKREMAEMQQELRWAMQFVQDHMKLAGNGVPPACGWPPIDPGNGPSNSPDTVTVLGNFKSILATLSQNMGNTGSQVKVFTTEGIEIGDLCIISDGTFSEIFLATDLTDTHIWHDTFLPWNDDGKLDHRYDAGSSLQIASYYTFYTDVDDNGVRNLYLRTQYYDGQVLLGDVEDFQVRYQMKDGRWEDYFDDSEVYDVRVVEVVITSKTPTAIKTYTDPIYGDGHRRVVLSSKIIPKNVVIHDDQGS